MINWLQMMNASLFDWYLYNMAEQKKMLTVGLFKKEEDNKLEDYI